MRSDEMTLEEKLAASIAIANHRRNMNNNGQAAMGASTPITALSTTSNKQLQSTAFMPVMDVDQAYARWQAIQGFIARIMTPDVDFGTIPGSRKPSLLKSGAEKLVAFFGLAPEFDVTERTEKWDGEGFFHYEIKCRLRREGEIRGEGLGSCNSREKKYRNSAPADLTNTVLKMAKKRALVDAVLNTTGASQFFTQDVEDMSPQGTREAQQAVAERKIQELRAMAEKPEVEWPAPEFAWQTRGEMRLIFAKLREAVGEVAFNREMDLAGVRSPAEFRYLDAARGAYSRLVRIAKGEVL